MKFVFGKGSSSLQDAGGIGSQGEFYYVPSKRPTLKAPDSAIGRECVIPIFPRNQVLAPLGEDNNVIYEMRYRQLFNDVGEGGVFGFLFYSPENQKFALVGTLARVKKLDRQDDGGMHVTLEGIGRFYIRDVLAEKPYLKCRVQTFKDYSEGNEVEARSLIGRQEQQLFEEIRYSVKLMRILYPQNNFTMSEAIMRYHPSISIPGVRAVSVGDEMSETERQTKFSFAVMDMLKTDPITKLLFLQEHVIQRRYAQMLKVVEESTAFLEGEMRKRGVLDEMGMRDLRYSTSSDLSDIETIQTDSWVPQNNINGEWTQNPVMMD
eukprot:CAMPEP_0182416504 /NCGR_PEP_ID=MMETSP1167-20130531/814_1 /TAXON_ID=2988 /ORGANISM="Mallomonas Sp, Strain CCMP3275" /LENGTH=320 /DNA_ID=CAMNT_0024589325 /DNA_START=310 /DNA_END=1272 /DNA_ORIENTATION=-